MGNLTLGDGITSPGSRDLVAVNMGTGALWAFPIVGGQLQSPVRIGSSGWTSMDAIVGISGFAGAGSAGVIARSRVSGVLHYYAATGAGGLSYVSVIGSGWGGIELITNAGDWDGDGVTDVVAKNPAGQLWLFVGDGGGRFAGGSRIGSGWGSMTNFVGGGEWTGDGLPDLLTVNAVGQLWRFPASSAGGFGSPTRIGTGWGGITLIS
ncbi:MAG: FG-GAP-like repeat-containing protein [Beutenbergiaceae bacterium]